MTTDSITELNELGRCWFRQALPEQELCELEHASATPDRPGARLNWSTQFALGLGSKSEMATLVESVMPDARPVRLVSFDKTPSSNWSVPWHQDRVVAIAERHKLVGYSNWARKAGVWHAEPPTRLLEDMLFARVHFDDADASNGCLELALGTHKHGLVPANQAAEVAANSQVETCIANRGDVLIVRALILHRSLSSQSTLSRRALRVDYANTELPSPLNWAIQNAV